MNIQHLMHEGSYKDRKNQIKDQKSKSSIIRTLPHPNGMIVWNECLMRSETRVGRMITGDAHRQGVKSIKSMKLKFLFSFDFFKSMKLRAMRSQMTKNTTMVSNNVFRSTRLFGEGSSKMVGTNLDDQSHHNCDKLEQTQIHPKPQVET